MNPTETPRTDARENSILITCDDSCCATYIEIDGNEHHEGVVDSDFARQLERELNESKAELSELWSRFDKQMEAEAEVERLKKVIESL